jgi:release factor glutamine methyltransferase
MWIIIRQGVFMVNSKLPATWAECLATSGLPALEARLLLEAISQKTRAWMLAHDTEPVPVDIAHRFVRNAEQRRAGQPLAYILGKRAFYGLEFAVTPATLIPRADTEVLVDWVIEAAKPNSKLLELGTGTGCICISVANARADLTWLSTDISQDALTVAQSNALQHQVDARIEFVQSNWYAQLRTSDLNKFDGVISNPPYIASDDPHLNQGDLRFEPRDALTDETNGLQHIEAIAAGARHYLKPGGFVALEHGSLQGREVRDILIRFDFQRIHTKQDLEHRDRFTVGYYS